MLVSAERRDRRSDRQPVDPLGRDRRLSSRCATTCWSRRRTSSTRSPPRWRRRCRTTPSTARPRPPARRPASISTPPAGSNGNRINLTYTDTLTNTQHQVSIVRVDDPAALPLGNDATADPNDEVIGVDFSGGMAAVVTQLNALFGGGLQFSNPSGTTLQVLDDGAAQHHRRRRVVDDARPRRRWPTAAAALPFFTDGGRPLHRRDQRGRLAERRLCRPHRGQSGAARRSVQARAVRRRHQRPAIRRGRICIYDRLTGRGVRVLARHRPRHASVAVHRHVPRLSAAGAQHAGRGGAERREPRAGPGRGGQRAQAARQRCVRRQYRRGNGQSAHAADRLWRQRARDVARCGT